MKRSALSLSTMAVLALLAETGLRNVAFQSIALVVGPTTFAYGIVEARRQSLAHDALMRVSDGDHKKGPSDGGEGDGSSLRSAPAHAGDSNARIADMLAARRSYAAMAESDPAGARSLYDVVALPLLREDDAIFNHYEAVARTDRARRDAEFGPYEAEMRMLHDRITRLDPGRDEKG